MAEKLYNTFSKYMKTKDQLQKWQKQNDALNSDPFAHPSWSFPVLRVPDLKCHIMQVIKLYNTPNSQS